LAESTVCRFPLFVEVLEQFVAGQVPAVLDDARQPAIIDVRFVPDTVFAAPCVG
jgi:hypothetical protein